MLLALSHQGLAMAESLKNTPVCRRAVFEGDALPAPPPDEGDSEDEEPAQDWAAGTATGGPGEAEGSGTDDSGAESDDSEGEPWCRFGLLKSVA